MKLKEQYIYLAVICILVIISYFSSLDHPFTYLDDQVQVVNNQNIRSLDLDHLKAIFSSTSVGMYQPISSLVYALTYQLAELNPFAYHTASLIIHLLNVILVFILFNKLDLNVWQSFLLTSIFALHPMQVESVSWISASSNLTFSLFFLLALISYLNYLRSDQIKFLIYTFLFFVLSCFSKATAVSLPFVLILIDYWKKGKLEIKDYLQKIPFLSVSVVFGLITINSREAAGHLSDLSVNFDLIDRLFLISYSILFYPFKFLWGFKLSAFYPYPELSNGFLPWEYYASFLLIIAMVWLLYRNRKNKDLLLGVFLFLIVIAPTLQFIPVGNQLTTDRYIYLPMIGLLLIIGWISKGQSERNLKLLSLAMLIGLGLMTHSRSQVWENDKTIWTDVIEKYPRVAQAYNNLGSYLLLEGKKQEAFQMFDKAIQLKPYYADAYNNRGNLYSQAGQSEKAMADFNKALELRPHADAYFNRANELSKRGNFTLALEDYNNSIQLQASPDAYTNKAYVLLNLNRDQEAVEALNQAIRLDPTYDQAYFLLAMEARKRVDFDEACMFLQKSAQYGNKKAAAGYQELCQNN